MSKLFIVPTPIGNLEDMTFRAVRTLKEADLILAEDTRVSGKLLKHFEVSTAMQAFHQHNEHKVLDEIITKLKMGNSIALISDAGTPGISDPGFLLVRECIKNDIEVETLPGATAFVLALVNSGLPCDRFYFEGFLPHKKGRKTRLEYLAELDQTIVLYESPYRVVKTLTQLAEFIGKERPASVSRELTKIYEQTARGTLEELVEHFKIHKPKGEFVIVIGGRE
jgi:16S rRNA (cytidine1402-2'-O)-methyltransferase